MASSSPAGYFQTRAPSPDAYVDPASSVPYSGVVVANVELSLPMYTSGDMNESIPPGETVCMGIDVESSGKVPIAVGLAVVKDRKTLHSAVYSRFRSDKRIAFSSSVVGFFGSHPTVLPALERMSKEAGIDSEATMAACVYDFIRSWQEKAKKQHFQVHIACDNPCFDIAELNGMFKRHQLPLLLPKNLWTGGYEMIHDVKSMAKAMYMILPNTSVLREHVSKRNTGCSVLLESSFEMPPATRVDGTGVSHSHMPDDDAICHAALLDAMYGISSGKYKMRV